MNEEPWLVVVDAQRVFADPDSPWGSPMWGQVRPAVERLVEQHAGRVVLTRFVADPGLGGSWADYYEEWPFAAVAPTDPLYDLVPELAGLDAPVVTEPTFGKWTAGLRAVVGPTPRLRLAGVSTDCCVLSTALAAADGGARVEVVGPACAGSTPPDHLRALETMALYGPHVVVSRAGARLV